MVSISCIPFIRNLPLFVLDFWGEEEDLGAVRHRGDCRRPIFFLSTLKHPKFIA